MTVESRKIQEKNRVAIPDEVLSEAGLSKGDGVVVYANGDGEIAVKSQDKARSDLQ